MKKIYLIIFLLMFVTSVSNAATRYSVASGDWSSTSTWSASSGGASGASVPVLGDIVIIEGGFDVTVTVDAECNSITILGTGSILTVNASVTLDVTSGITFQNAAGSTTSATIAGSGTINCASFSVGGSTTPTSDATTTLTSTISTIAISGNLNITGMMTGTNDNDAIFNFASGTVTVSGTVTLVSNDAGSGGSGDATLALNTGAQTGTLNLSGATPFSLSGTGTETTSLSGTGATVNYSYAGVQTILSTTYTNLTLSGSGAKTVTGATVNGTLSIQGTATAAGTSPSYGGAAILEYKGSAAQTTSNVEFQASMLADVIIDNAAGVTLNAAKNLDGNLTLTSGTLTAGTNLTMGSTGTPLITRSGGDMTGTLQGTNDYSVTYTGNSKTTGSELNNGGLSTVTVNLTTGQTLTLDANRTPDGNVTITEGIFDVSTFTINRSAAGGTFNIDDGGWLKIGGTNSFPTNYSSSTFGNVDATVEYAGTAQAVAAIAGDSYTNVVLSGSGIKTFAAETINNLLSIQGTATTAGGFTYGASAILEYKGSAAQTTSDIEFPAAMSADVTINNGSGVILNGAKTLSGNLTLTNGLLTTTSANLLTLASTFSASGYSDNSFINGPMAKIGTTAFTFPVGKLGAGLRTIGIGTPSASSTFNAEFFRTDPHTAVGSTLGAGVTQISACEYWVLNRTAGGNATVILSWASTSTCNGASYITDMAALRVARWTGASWTNEGNNGSPTGTTTAGTVTTSAAVTSFSPFSLGTSSSSNPLPVKLSSIKAFEKQQGVQIEWTAYQEENLSRYSVERSANGSTFISIGEVAARNSASETSYGFFDANPLSGISFYRLKSIDIDNKFAYSSIVKVNLDKNVKDISLYPNPATGGYISFQGADLAKGNYTVKVYNSTGMQVMSQNFNHTGGAITQTLKLPTGISSGMYSLQLVNEGVKVMSKTFMVQ